MSAEQVIDGQLIKGTSKLFKLCRQYGKFNKSTLIFTGLSKHWHFENRMWSKGAPVHGCIGDSYLLLLQ